MPLSDCPSSFGPVRVGVFVDGFNLYYGGRGLCGKGESGWRWLDLRALAGRIVANHQAWKDATIERVVYCTAVISGADNPVGSREQDAYLRALKQSGTVDRIELGNYVHRVARAPLAIPDRKGRPVLVRPGGPVIVKNSADTDDPSATFMVSAARQGEKGSDVYLTCWRRRSTRPWSSATTAISNSPWTRRDGAFPWAP